MYADLPAAALTNVLFHPITVGLLPDLSMRRQRRSGYERSHPITEEDPDEEDRLDGE
jgi:hypothetical protein